MSTVASLQALAAKPKALGSLANTGLLLQRKCACGSPTSSLTGACAECKSGKRLQTKLAIGASNDPLEREADRVADQVLAAPAHPSVGNAAPKIQRDARDSDAAAQDAPASVDRALASSCRPLDAPLRHDMEQRFGHDFSRVRVHADSAAQQSARDVNAKAYTVGQDIAFGAGQFAPATQAGQRLLAHELTHVVQQSGLGGTPVAQSNETMRLTSNNETAASSAVQRSTSFASGLDFSHISIQCADPKGSGGAGTPANTISTANDAPKPATATADPTMTSGSLAITETPLTVVQQGGQILANSMGFKIAKPFTVSASAVVQEPSSAEPFEYGVVQNVFFEHIEEVFSDGDMLVDSVGPMVDSEPSEAPFIHANARMPTSLFTSLRVGPSFTDIPSLEVMLKMLHCKKKKPVELKTVVRSLQFRAGLVARGLKTGRVVQLGAIQTTYGFKSQVDFTGPSFKSTDASNLTGSYPLSASASAVITDGPIANEEGQAALNTETASFEQRCENVL